MLKVFYIMHYVIQLFVLPIIKQINEFFKGYLSPHDHILCHFILRLHHSAAAMSFLLWYLLSQIEDCWQQITDLASALCG